MVNGASTVRPIGPSGRASGVTTARAPMSAARRRRNGLGSTTVMSVTPWLSSTASVSSPTGPPPVMRTRSSGPAPDRLTVWRAIAVGSRERSRQRVVRPSGMLSSLAWVAGTATRRLNAPRKERKSGTGRRRHTDGRPRRQARHEPQPGVGPATTRAPVSQSVTSAPTPTTVPAHSWPRTDPGRARFSRTRCRSVPHTPQCDTSTRASPGPTVGTGTSWTDSAPSPTYTAAGMVCPAIVPPVMDAPRIVGRPGRRRSGRRAGRPGGAPLDAEAPLAGRGQRRRWRGAGADRAKYQPFSESR